MDRAIDALRFELASLSSDILALEEPPTVEDATAMYAPTCSVTKCPLRMHRRTARLRCIEWGASHAPPPLSQIIFRQIPTALETISIEAAANILDIEQKSFLAIHDGEDWVGIVEAQSVADALRYELGHVAVSLIAGEAPSLIDIDAPITLARELIRRSTAPILMVLEQGKTVGYVDAQSLLAGLRPQPLPHRWRTAPESKPVAERLLRLQKPRKSLVPGGGAVGMCLQKARCGFGLLTIGDRPFCGISQVSVWRRCSSARLGAVHWLP